MERQAAASLEAVQGIENRNAESLELERKRWQEEVAKIEADIRRNVTHAEDKIRRNTDTRLANIEKVLLFFYYYLFVLLYNTNHKCAQPVIHLL